VEGQKSVNISNTSGEISQLRPKPKPSQDAEHTSFAPTSQLESSTPWNREAEIDIKAPKRSHAHGGAGEGEKHN